MPVRKSRNSPRQPMQDGLQNVVANLGTGRDKAAHSHYVASFMSPAELQTAYRASWLAQAIINNPAEDATRKWRKWRAPAEQITKIEALEKKLQLPARVKDALQTAGLLGGSAIYMNMDGADQDQPIDETKELRSLVVLPCTSLQPVEIVRDINSIYYGKAELYRMTTTGDKSEVIIHASRLAIFMGNKVPGDQWLTNAINRGWGDSRLQPALDPVMQYDSTMANMASLVYEAKVDVFKFAGFADALGNSADEAGLTRRLSAQAAMKGINGAVVIDMQDDYQQKSATFSGLPELVAKQQEGVAGAAGQPVTRIFGRAVAGLSGSGDGDERVYYDRIGHMQADDITPALSVLDEVLITQALGTRPPDVYYTWTPLRQLSESERADVFVKTANAARSLAGTTAGPIIPLDALSDSVVNELTEQGVLPGLDQAIEQYGTLAEQDLPIDNGVQE